MNHKKTEPYKALKNRNKISIYSCLTGICISLK